MMNSAVRKRARLVTTATLFFMLCFLNVSANAATARTDLNATNGQDDITSVVVYDEELEEEIELMLLAPVRHHDGAEVVEVEAAPVPAVVHTNTESGLEEEKPVATIATTAHTSVRRSLRRILTMFKGV